MHKINGKLYHRHKASGFDIISHYRGVPLPEVPGWTWILYCGEPRIQNDADENLFGYITDMRNAGEEDMKGKIDVDFFRDDVSDPTETVCCDTIEQAAQRLVIWAQLGGY